MKKICFVLAALLAAHVQGAEVPARLAALLVEFNHIAAAGAMSMAAEAKNAWHVEPGAVNKLGERGWVLLLTMPTERMQLGAASLAARGALCEVLWRMVEGDGPNPLDVRFRAAGVVQIGVVGVAKRCVL